MSTLLTEGTQEAVWAVLVDAVKKPFHDTLLATFLFPTNKVTKPLINYTGGIDGVRRSHVAFYQYPHILSNVLQV